MFPLLIRKHIEYSSWLKVIMGLNWILKKYIKSDNTEVFEIKVFKKIQVERAVNAGTT